MTVLSDLVQEATNLDEVAIDHLQLLLEDWKILADLSFADLLLWVPAKEATGTKAYLCVGQIRPYTAQTIYPDDLVGEAFPANSRPIVGRALYEGRVIRDADPDWSTGVPVREEAVPVRLPPMRVPGEPAAHRQGEIIAVVTREANLSQARSPSPLELTYLQTAGELAQMVADGTFPYDWDTGEQELSPRVGDGLVRVGNEGEVVYASPNAVSAYRRLGVVGNVVGCTIAEFDPDPQELLHGMEAGRCVEVEVERKGGIVRRRLLPLIGRGEVTAAVLLVREVTELRRHEHALRLKDATIREIHHRVKNNLQTVASLLRLQGRRLQSEEAREALAESVRRIASIALVHETLSQESRQRVPFDKIARRVVTMLAEGLVDPVRPVVFELDGSAGDLPAEVASPLALVLTELLQNSVEHAFPERLSGDADAGGTVRTTFERRPGSLRVTVRDDGIGLPAGELESLANLGLQIAQLLVEAELGGTFRAVPSEKGATMELVVPLG
jgi:two-component system, sensor histidine kinase PdtaS